MVSHPPENILLTATAEPNKFDQGNKIENLIFDMYLELRIHHRQGGKGLGIVHSNQGTIEVGHMNQNLHEEA